MTTFETVKDLVDFYGENIEVRNLNTNEVLEIEDSENMIVVDFCDDDDFEKTILFVDGSKPYEVQLHYESAIKVLDEKFATLEDAIEECKSAICDSDNKYYAGGIAIVKQLGEEGILFNVDIPEKYTGRPERFSCMTYAEAEEMAKDLTPKLGYAEQSEADCDNMPCPRDLDSWSGTINAIRVYNVWNEEVAVIGYWG